MYSPYTVEVKKIRRKYRSLAKPEDVEVTNEFTGEITRGVKFIGGMKTYDTTDFIKLYDWKIMMSLSRCGVAALCYIMDTIRFDSYIVFDMKKCLKFTKYKKTKSIYDGLNELLALDILRKNPEVNNGFFVNPNILFRGDRSRITDR